ncbi:hypothetical protein BD410DRAFT_790458 [Rickenella mellea]|uniref:MYND-type domain-containing protein n=1 Tax=Rickenella mellea TaxID=50990 RepID=A0A4Y7PZG7_9AGAM|nr:hypothetical protein BD410DRAFT_790458 [Rickenella mellea]
MAWRHQLLNAFCCRTSFQVTSRSQISPRSPPYLKQRNAQMAAVASYYSHPTPASHPHQMHKSRGYRQCDTCGAAEQPGLQKFRMCGGCMITQYCSQDCQKSHWPSHKAICQHTTSVIAAAKQEPSTDENVAKNLRKFCSAHQTLLSWSAFQALQLKRLPANVRQSALLIELSARNSSDPNRRLAVASTHIVPRSYVESRDPLVAQDIQRREERCRRSGGIGTAVVMIQCGGVCQIMPVECDPPSKITWDTREDWADILTRYVESGRTDFKPITTTSKGVYYG